MSDPEAERRRASDEPTIVHDAREAVLQRLAERHDHFSELEQLHRAVDDVPQAEGAHQYALWTLRAYRAEMGEAR